jgi:hypothetical protein
MGDVRDRMTGTSAEGRGAKIRWVRIFSAGLQAKDSSKLIAVDLSGSIEAR